MTLVLSHGILSKIKAYIMLKQLPKQNTETKKKEIKTKRQKNQSSERCPLSSYRSRDPADSKT